MFLESAWSLVAMNPDPSRSAERRDEDCLHRNQDGEMCDPLERSSEELAGGPDRPEEESSGECEFVQEYVDPDVQSRLWLKAVVPLLQLRSHEADPNGRVQFAFDLMYIAACERIARILQSDVTSAH
jgi:hypothetical protein